MSDGEKIQLTDEQIERLIHRVFVFAVRVIYTAHDIDTTLQDPKTWKMLRQVALGKTEVAIGPDPSAAEALGEELARIMGNDQLMAQIIFRDVLRVFEESGDEPPPELTLDEPWFEP